MSEPNETYIERGSLDGLMAALEVPPQATQTDVSTEFEIAKPKIDEFLQQGFYSWTEKNVDGHLGSIASVGTWTFTVRQRICNGLLVRTLVDGEYTVGSDNVVITYDQGTGSPIFNACVFINGRLVASRSDPFDEPTQKSFGELSNISKNNTSRLAAAVQDTQNPYPLVAKRPRNSSV